MFSSCFAAAAKGFALGAGFIVAIGSQNAFVLQQGLLRRYVSAVVAVCILGDVLLIALGVLGVGTLLAQVTWLVPVAAAAGALFLLAYGMRTIRRALRPTHDALVASNKAMTSQRKTILLALAFTFLNPHVYLDTVILLGTLASTYHGTARLAFAMGAMAASIFWFMALGYGARLLQPVFAKPIAWRIVDFIIGISLFAIAASLASKALVIWL